MAVLSVRTLDRLTAALVAFQLLDIVASTCAKWPILFNARRIRWWVLGALLLVTVVLLLRQRVRPRRLVPAAALALGFLGLAFLSVTWSAAGSLTWPHAVSLALLVATVGGIAYARVGSPERLALQLEALVGGAALVAVAGVAMLVFERSSALQPRAATYPTRYRGLGGNPDTAALLFAIALPAALAFALRPGPRRWLHAAVCVLLVCSIAPSASRGAALAGAVGTTLVVLLLLPRARQRVLAVVAIGLVVVAAVGVSKIPKPAGNPVPPPAFNVNAEIGLPLFNEPGFLHHTPGVRTLTSSSGRTTAWRGALRQARDRIFVGYGYATEDKVFIDRYPAFFARRVENAYLGTLLELGLAGLGLLLALVVAILWPLRGALRLGADRTLVVAGAGAFTAGLVLAGVQSYLWSVGGTGSLAVWLAAALLVASSRTPNSA